MSNTNNNMQTQTSSALHNAIMEASGKYRPLMLAPGNYNPPYKFKWTEKTIPVAEGSSETRIDNDIYSTVDACLNACEMWKAIKRLKQGESINVQDLKTNLFWEFGKFTSRDGETLESYYSSSYFNYNQNGKATYNEVNEIRAERLARTANPLALVAQQQPVYYSQPHPTYYTQNSSTRSHQAATRNRGKVIVNSPLPIYDQEHDMVTEDDALSNEKEIDKLMALISLSFKKIYKPTNNNLRTSSNTSTQVVQQSEIQCFNCKEYGHVARECQKSKRVKDAAYHNEKMLLCKQEEAGVQLSAEQVTSDAADNSGPIFDAEPLQKVQHDDDYNVFANDRQHPEQPESADHDDDDLAKERNLFASLIEKLKCEIDDNMKKVLIAHQESISIMSQEKEAHKKFYKTREDKELEKVIALENKIKFLKKAQRANPRLYDIGCYNDNLALMLAPESDEMIRVIPTTSVSRPQLKSNQLEDRVMPNNSQGKKQETLDVNFVCVTCGKYMLNDNHDMSVLHYINGLNSITKMPMAMPISTREPKRTVNQSAATPLKRTIAAESTNQKPRSKIGKQYEQIRIKSRTITISKPTTLRKSTISNTPLSANYFAARRDNSIRHRLWVLKPHDKKSQASK
ncbi:retrovirus-related pol polyprotein from transposon TNT 1-94 [Tanacetum coccineum]